ncbi:MAG: elongation factor Ts [Candidatus Zambryskibacteria bacterium]|nr:elongation factor Ts [Candidatus Zambryskibacteria bacterium]
MITLEQIKELRAETGLSVIQCQKALEEAGELNLTGSDLMVKAIEILKAKGAEIAGKKSDRSLGAGTVASYIHSGDTVGVLLELLSETDFVSKNPEFKNVAKEIAMHIAAMNPSTSDELVGQPYIKDPSKTIGDLINNTVQKFGERTEIGRFIRFSIK